MNEGTGFRTIKALVFDFVHRCGGDVDYDRLTQEVLAQFPDSQWKKSHWAWYRYQIVNGRFKGLFAEQERAALSRGTSKRAIGAGSDPAAPKTANGATLVRGPQPRDAEVKRIGDAALDQVRLIISLAAGDDMDKRFRLNRWVFSRLLQDEIRIKRPIKKRLFDGGMQTCQACGEPFKSLKGVEIHRKDESLNYTAENCELVCRECHQDLN